MNKRINRMLGIGLLVFVSAVAVLSVQSQTFRTDGRVASCPAVSNTPFFTIVYGSVTFNGTAAVPGMVVEARNPRGDVVGCFVVAAAGNYGAMYVYGEDTSVSPTVPGMRAGETVAFYVSGNAAVAAPSLVWSNDQEVHQIDLSASGATPTPTSTPTVTPTPSATPVTPKYWVYLPAVLK